MPGDSKDTTKNKLLYFPCSISVLSFLFFPFFFSTVNHIFVREPGSFWVTCVLVQSITSD